MTGRATAAFSQNYCLALELVEAAGIEPRGAVGLQNQARRYLPAPAETEPRPVKGGVLLLGGGGTARDRERVLQLHAAAPG